MISPYIRRLRLGAEIRKLRTSRGLTCEALGESTHQSRMKITRLEHGQARINLIDVLDLLDFFQVDEPLRSRIIQFARDGASKGWWDEYGESMGVRQRLFAEVEAGCSGLREYHPHIVSGILQTRRFTEEMVHNLDATFTAPPRVTEARQHRQAVLLRPGGPTYEVVLHEEALRQFPVSPAAMRQQVAFLIELIETARIAVYVRKLATRQVTQLPPKSQIALFTFPDPDDPPIVIESGQNHENIHTSPDAVARLEAIYDYLRDEALSGPESFTFLTDLHQDLSR